MVRTPADASGCQGQRACLEARRVRAGARAPQFAVACRLAWRRIVGRSRRSGQSPPPPPGSAARPPRAAPPQLNLKCELSKNNRRCQLSAVSCQSAQMRRPGMPDVSFPPPVHGETEGGRHCEFPADSSLLITCSLRAARSHGHCNAPPLSKRGRGGALHITSPPITFSLLITCRASDFPDFSG